MHPCEILPDTSMQRIWGLGKPSSPHVNQRLNWHAIIAALVIVVSPQRATAQTNNPSTQQPVSWTKPAALKPGDTIAIVAPAGPVEMEKVQAYAKMLKSAGYQVRMSPTLDRRSGYLAGPDEQRIEELNAAIRDPAVRAIFPVRGGYGLTRIVDKIDYAALREHPKIVTGYSDLTALHLAIARHTRLITFHSPVPMSNLWNALDPKFTFANQSFVSTIESIHYTREQIGYIVAMPENWKPAVLSPGKARGRLLGGNLTLIAATLGTEYAIEPEGAILFIEDIEEAPYRVDRMLSQLRLAGVLDKISGLIIGDFSYKDGTEQAQMEAVFHDYFDRANIPVLWKFPLGHIPENTTLPHGALAELDADLLTLRLLENPVIP